MNKVIINITLMSVYHHHSVMVNANYLAFYKAATDQQLVYVLTQNSVDELIKRWKDNH